jgi:CheY-like chemotaxis protein
MKTIIIAEDDPSIQDAAKMILETDGYKIVVYSNGDPIINNECDTPDLLILDKLLAGIDGLDICRYLKTRELTKNIPVVMLSASPSIVQLAQAAGADGALEKPFRIKELRQLVAKFIG